MLRTRLYLGLLPFLLLLLATGSYAVIVSRQFTGSMQRELIADYAAVLASQRMRAAATAMSRATSVSARSDPLEAQRIFDDARAAFTRELMAQSAAAAAGSRAPLIAALDEALHDYTQQAGAALRLGGPGSLPTTQRLETALYRLFAAIEELNRRDYAAALATAARAESLATTTLYVVLGGIAAALLISLVLAWRFSSFLLQPIQELTASVLAIGDGNLDRRCRSVRGMNSGNSRARLTTCPPNSALTVMRRWPMSYARSARWRRRSRRRRIRCLFWRTTVRTRYAIPRPIASCNHRISPRVFHRSSPSRSRR